jgi:hypothetical protein
LGRDQAQARAGAGDEDLRHEDSLTPLLVHILIRRVACGPQANRDERC